MTDDHGAFMWFGSSTIRKVVFDCQVCFYVVHPGVTAVPFVPRGRGPGDGGRGVEDHSSTCLQESAGSTRDVSHVDLLTFVADCGTRS